MVALGQGTVLRGRPRGEFSGDCIDIGWRIEARCRFSVRPTVFSCAEPVTSNQPFANQSGVFPSQMTENPSQTAMAGRAISPLGIFVS